MDIAYYPIVDTSLTDYKSQRASNHSLNTWSILYQIGLHCEKKDNILLFLLLVSCSPILPHYLFPIVISYDYRASWDSVFRQDHTLLCVCFSGIIIIKRFYSFEVQYLLQIHYNWKHLIDRSLRGKWWVTSTLYTSQKQWFLGHPLRSFGRSIWSPSLRNHL